jgi:glycerol-3-phosphate dehydrogenase (NAD(P)+)
MATSGAAIAVLGAGSWGTALAIQCARAGNVTRLWGRDAGLMRDTAQQRCNRRYLPNAPLPENLLVSDTLAEAIIGVREVLGRAQRQLSRAAAAVEAVDERRWQRHWSHQGIRDRHRRLPHQVAREIFGEDRPMAVLSGPTFAREVGAGLPTAMAIASTDAELPKRWPTAVVRFLRHTPTDIIGVEVGGAVKNVLAIGAGLSDGLGYGANSRIALITRGLVEMTRLGGARGAQRETFMGLAGLGDLVLTCTDDQSRNRRLVWRSPPQDRRPHGRKSAR